MATLKLPFTKMHGLGNDFVVLHHKDLPPNIAIEKLAATLCDRHFGVGADGLIVVSPPDDAQTADLKFVYLNGDGSWAEMCGNGIRCFAVFAKQHGYINSNTFKAETRAGLLTLTLKPDNTVTVNMGAPVLEAQKIPFISNNGLSANSVVRDYPLEVLNKTLPVTLVSMGNPHCLIFQNDLDSPVDPAQFGPAVETHPNFPNKTNVEFLEVINDHTLKATVWERGCGFTLACGTGACASAVGAMLLDKITASAVDVILPGGTLNIEWDRSDVKNPVMMTGPAQTVFTGLFEGSI